VFEMVAEGAWADVDDQRVCVDRTDAREPAQIHHHPAKDWDGRPAHPRASAGGGDRDVRLVADRQHRSDSVVVGWAHHETSETTHSTVSRPRHGEWPPVPGCLSEARTVSGDGAADGRGERRDDMVGNRDRVPAET
jgi:hypothetical protein